MGGHTCTVLRTCTVHIRVYSKQVPRQDDHPWNPQTRTTTETVLLREAMQAALVRVQQARPHACEDCGGDPSALQTQTSLSSRVGTSTVAYRDVFYPHLHLRLYLYLYMYLYLRVDPRRHLHS
jgi:hypothetical protein